MAKRKLSLLIQMMSSYSQLSEADRAHFADYIRSQQPQRKLGKKPVASEAKADSKLVKQLQERTGATVANCKAVLTESGGDLDTAEALLRARNLAPKAAEAEQPR